MRLLHPLFALFAAATDRELARVVEYLKLVNRLLRSQLPDRVRASARAVRGWSGSDSGSGRR